MIVFDTISSYGAGFECWEAYLDGGLRTTGDTKRQPGRRCTVDAGSSGPASPYEWLLEAAAAPYNDLSPAIPIAGDEDNLSFLTTGDPTARWW